MKTKPVAIRLLADGRAFSFRQPPIRITKGNPALNGWQGFFF